MNNDETQKHEMSGEILGNEEADDDMHPEDPARQDPSEDSQELEGKISAEAEGTVAPPPTPHGAQRRPPRK